MKADIAASRYGVKAVGGSVKVLFPRFDSGPFEALFQVTLAFQGKYSMSLPISHVRKGELRYIKPRKARDPSPHTTSSRGPEYQGLFYSALIALTGFIIAAFMAW